MVPSPPFDAVNVVLLQTVPPPLTVTVAGNGFTVAVTAVLEAVVQPFAVAST